MRISLRGVNQHFGNKKILESIDCEIEPGQLIALVGTNGAGKTTLLKTLATLIQPSGGEILFDGQQLSRQRLDLRAKLHYLSDTPVFGGRTPLDHIAMSAHLYGRCPAETKNEIVQWLKSFDILECANTFIKSLSRGQQYKSAFIGLAAANPQLWLLDEPFAAGVDPPGISAMKRVINKAIGSSRTVIYSTQIVELAEQFSDRVLVVHRGEIAVDIPTQQLRESKTDQTLARLFENLRLAK